LEVLNFLQSNSEAPSSLYKIPILSIAPQTLASLAASISCTLATQITLQQVLRWVQSFCKTVLGFAHVWDTTFARHIALLEHAREFVERKEGGEGKVPMLASACPGWICYAEKTHKEMLPFISRAKSPQQVMGTLVKTWMGERWGKT
jgi:iron only hydrogenase large subunit-like protein